MTEKKIPVGKCGNLVINGYSLRLITNDAMSVKVKDYYFKIPKELHPGDKLSLTINVDVLAE